MHTESSSRFACRCSRLHLDRRCLSRLCDGTGPEKAAYNRNKEEPTQLPIQTGALPWRLDRNRRFEVLLVTGRRSGRWTVPKGWPMPGKSLSEAAAQEAFEEAGVMGKVDPEPLGSFRHSKQNLPIGDLEVSILVHLMYVERELSEWPEVEQRERKWFTAEEAVERVGSKELGELIIQSARRALTE
jgi:8-oxo-dGTP pyrophosphatase MutT (NUDIX family)